MPWLCSFLSDAITEYADALDLHFYDVSLFQRAIQFQTRAASGCARAKDIAWIERLRLRRIRDQVGERMVHVCRSILTPHFTVDAHNHACIGCIQCVCGDDTGTKDVGTIPILRLGGSQSNRQLASPQLACPHCASDGRAEGV